MVTQLVHGMASARLWRQATVRLLVLWLATVAVWSLSRLYYTSSSPLHGSLVEHHHHHDHHAQLQDSHLIETVARGSSSSHVMANVSGAGYANFDVAKSANVTLLLKKLSNNALSNVQVGTEPTAHIKNCTCVRSHVTKKTDYYD
jgi:hypothetical protein